MSTNEFHWGCSHKIGGRPYQEDTYITNITIGDMYLFGVFDGHGGNDVSSFLADNFSDFISNSIDKHSNLESALKAAFIDINKNLPNQDNESNSVGSTSNIVLLNKEKIICANCGDSRAVLFKNNEIISLSEDHKPERVDEKERIEKAGGFVFHNTGIPRVMGILNMSRAIGDLWLNKFGVIPDPDIITLDRTPLDEFIIIASDGLWDSLSSEKAVQLTKRCIDRALIKGASRNAATRIAANVLAKTASTYGSTDNITVIIILLNN